MYLKNKKGRIVEVEDSRAEYLLNPNPVLLNKHGKPKLNEDGDPFPLVKDRGEEGYTKPTAAEIKAYEEEEQRQRDRIEQENELKSAGAQAMVAAALLANKANKVSKPGRPRKEKAATEEAQDDAKEDDELKGTI